MPKVMKVVIVVAAAISRKALRRAAGERHRSDFGRAAFGLRYDRFRQGEKMQRQADEELQRRADEKGEPPADRLVEQAEDRPEDGAR